MRLWSAIAISLLLLAAPGRAPAAELLMFESPVCEWCEVWDEELGEVYAKTAEGKRAPLRRVDVFDPMPDDLKGLDTVRYTPTFVLMDRGQEVGRIRGYPGEDFFWTQLEQLLNKMQPNHACRTAGATSKNKKETGEC